MITVIRDTPNVFKGKQYLNTDDQEKAIDLLSDAIVNKPTQVEKYLQKYNYQVAVTGIKEKNLLEGIIAVFNTSDEAKNDLIELVGANKYSNVTDGYTAATVAILDSFKSIFNAFKKPDASEQQQQFNAQMAALLAQKQAQSSRNQTIAIVSLIILAALMIGGIVFYYRKKNRQ